MIPKGTKTPVAVKNIVPVFKNSWRHTKVSLKKR